MRFTIRDILWLTTLVAVSAAWWADHRSGHAEQDRLLGINRDLGFALMWRGQ